MFRENSVEKMFLLRKQTNFSSHKHSQLNSPITGSISVWKVYFRSPPGEIYARNLQWTLVFRIALKAERIVFGARFFLETIGAKWGRQIREIQLESKLKRLGGKNKLVKEKAAASNEPVNFRESSFNMKRGRGWGMKILKLEA